MSKKGLISSLIIGLIATLTLGIYTIVSAVAGTNPVVPINTTVDVAFRTGDVAEIFEGYSKEKGNITFKLAEGQTSPFEYNAETGEYTAVSAGEVTAVLKLKGGNTKTVKASVFAQGTGTSKEDAFVIANAGNLVDFAEQINNISTERNIPAYVLVVADIDLAGIDWKPIGNYVSDYGNIDKTGDGSNYVFDGNDKTISNMTIKVTEDNYNDYLVRSGDTTVLGSMYLGLFGNIVRLDVNNLNVVDANISISPNLYNTLRELSNDEISKFVELNIGTIAARTDYCNINGGEQSSVVTRINGFNTSNATDNYATGLGGLVGIAFHSQISNYNVTANIINNNENVKDSVIGGIVGNFASYTDMLEGLNVNKIENVSIDFTASATYNNDAMIGGFVGTAINSQIISSEVTKFKIIDVTHKNDVENIESENLTQIGGIAGNFDARLITDGSAEQSEFEAKVVDVTVSGVDVLMYGGHIGGVFYAINSDSKSNVPVTITDVTVAGSINADIAAGFVVLGGVLKTEGESDIVESPAINISYTKAFDTPVVNIKIKARAGFAFAYQLYFATISGFDATTTVKSNIVGLGAKITSSANEDVELYRNQTMVSGFAGGVVESTISKFYIDVEATSSLNYSGLAAVFALGSVALDIVIEADFTSYNYKTEAQNYSTTYTMAGAVMTLAGATLDNVDVTINANKGVDTSLKYGVAYFGGLVARHYGDSVSMYTETAEQDIIRNCSVTGEVYFNYTPESRVIVGDDASYPTFVAGGIIGAISSYYGDVLNVDNYGSVYAKNLKIENNVVSNFKITADMNLGKTTAEGGWAGRAIGVIVGVVKLVSGEQSINISSNTVDSVTIVANADSFAYEQSGATSTTLVSTLGNNRGYGVVSYDDVNMIGKDIAVEEGDITFEEIANA